MLQDACLVRRTTFPSIPCEEKECDWFLKETEFNNCFWVLSAAMVECPKSFSVEEIAKLEGLSVEEAQNLIDEAVSKYRENIRGFIKDF